MGFRCVQKSMTLNYLERSKRICDHRQNSLRAQRSAHFCYTHVFILICPSTARIRKATPSCLHGVLLSSKYRIGTLCLYQHALSITIQSSSMPGQRETLAKFVLLDLYRLLQKKTKMQQFRFRMVGTASHIQAQTSYGRWTSVFQLSFAARSSVCLSADPFH